MGCGGEGVGWVGGVVGSWVVCWCGVYGDVGYDDDVVGVVIGFVVDYVTCC